MSADPLPEDLDADPLSIVLEHLDFACRTADVADLAAPIDHDLAGGEARLHFVIEGAIACSLEADRSTGEPPESRWLEAGEGVVITGPARYRLRPLPESKAGSRDSHVNGNVPDACLLLDGEMAYSAMEFPPASRFLPKAWSGSLAMGKGGTLPEDRCRELLQELRRRSASPHDGASTLLAQYIAIELGRAHLSGAADGPITPLVAVLRDPQLAALVGLLIRTLAHRWDVEDLARRLECGRRTFAGRVREVSGFSPFELLTVLRMQRVSRHLAAPGISLKQLPALVGYRSLSALGVAFHKVGRLTLAESRARALGFDADLCRDG